MSILGRWGESVKGSPPLKVSDNLWLLRGDSQIMYLIRPNSNSTNISPSEADLRLVSMKQASLQKAGIIILSLV